MIGAVTLVPHDSSTAGSNASHHIAVLLFAFLYFKMQCSISCYVFCNPLESAQVAKPLQLQRRETKGKLDVVHPDISAVLLFHALPLAVLEFARVAQPLYLQRREVSQKVDELIRRREALERRMRDREARQRQGMSRRHNSS
eukprot:1159696-Pelagomonas_calceolata.AAC.21